MATSSRARCPIMLTNASKVHRRAPRRRRPGWRSEHRARGTICNNTCNYKTPRPAEWHQRVGRGASRGVLRSKLACLWGEATTMASSMMTMVLEHRTRGTGGLRRDQESPDSTLVCIQQPTRSHAVPLPTHRAELCMTCPCRNDRNE
jgi:hypothetical protein